MPSRRRQTSPGLTPLVSLSLLVLAFLSGGSRADAATTKFALKSFDGFELGSAVDMPDGSSESDIRRVVILIHGSGPHDMDEDLSAASAPGTRNLFFVDVSSALVRKGFAVIRYNKRSYESRERGKADKGFLDSEVFVRYSRNPLEYFVEDARHYVAWAGKRFPNARIYLLGHSEGAKIALQVAHTAPTVAGVALVGFMAHGLDTALFEQLVYRGMWVFDSLDMDSDGALDEAELSGAGRMRASLSAQKRILDLDHDGKIQRSEFMAGNYSNVISFYQENKANHIQEYLVQEARYPRPADIIKDARFKIAFFQGEWDNQTPSYNAKAIELLNDTTWKKPDLRFHFFPRLGHALDKRTSYNDIVFQPADPAALEAAAVELDSFWED